MSRLNLPVLLLLLAGVFALRCFSAATLPLFSVEAYYWLWNRHIAAGYFDHPPMVAWASRLFFGWVDGVELAARASALALGLATLAAVFALARELYDARVAAWWTALYAVVPIFDLNGTLLQPDNSLVLTMALTWLFFWRATMRQGLGNWLAAGAFAGLALLSKFHAWVLLPPLWGFLFFSRDRRRLLTSGGPWLAVLVALVVLSPNLLWNADHGWLNYRFQWQRSDIPRAQLRLENVLVYWLAPFASLSPLLFIAVVRAVGIGIRRLEERTLYLLCAGLPLPLFLACLAPFVTINPHWPAAGFVPLVLLAVGLASEGQLFGRRYWSAAAVTAAIMTTSMHLLPLWITASPDPKAGQGKQFVLNPARMRRELLPWPQIGRELSAELESTSRPRLLMADQWHRAALLAFYARQPLNTFCLEADDAHNFELWRRDAGGLIGKDALVVLNKGNPNQKHETIATKYDKFHRYLDPLFESVVPVPSIRIHDDGAVMRVLGVDISRPAVAEFLVFDCRKFGGPITLGKKDVTKP
jgi:4-amino-4-deoxy-L-arabinose transferase-like glycosyltransferase